MLKQQNEVLARQNEALITSSQQIIQMYAEQQQMMMYIIGMRQDREVFKNIKPVERKIAGDR